MRRMDREPQKKRPNFTKLGKMTEILGEKEFKELKYGMDFRKPKYRREVFLRFYEFHLKYRSHPGGVYYIFPYLFDHLKMTQEQKYWFVFINGVCQNVVTTYLIFSSFPDLEKIKVDTLSDYFRKHYAKFGWDTDRRYVKNHFEDAVRSYKSILGGRTQVEYFNALAYTDCKQTNFNDVWAAVMTNFYSFGRLATFSYLEYLRIAGLNIDCSSLFIGDITGSKSHRNGLCKVLGRDDLDWTKDNPVTYDDKMLLWLTDEGKNLLEEARERIDHPDVSYFTLESTLCCYKSWHRKNRRYPNVYNDMLHDRIQHAEMMWGSTELFRVFWAARNQYLPHHLRREDNPRDLGVDKRKQNHYLITGEVIMMDNEWECFTNKYNDYVR